MVQTVVGRRSAVGASANGRPTMVFNGSNVHLWPASPALISLTKFGVWFWVKFSAAAVTSGGALLSHIAGLGGATLSRFSIGANNGSGTTNTQSAAYITNTTGRSFGSPYSGITSAVWYAFYLQYDSSRGGDPNVALFTGGLNLGWGPPTINIGAGGTLTTLQASNGSILVGGQSDADAPASALGNGAEMIPPVTFNDNLTAAEIASMLTWRAP